MVLLRERHGPLTADFHRYYGRSLSSMEDWGIPLREVADMAAHLPVESSTYRAENPGWRETWDVQFLRSIEHNGRVLAWMKTVDGSKGRNFPDPIPLPSDPEPEGVERGDAMTMAEAAEWLGWTDLIESEVARG